MTPKKNSKRSVNVRFLEDYDLYQMEQDKRSGFYERPAKPKDPSEFNRSKLLDADLEVVNRTNVPPVPRVPIKNKPPVAAKYHTMGEHLNMSPYELSQILEDEIDITHPLIAEALKRLIMTIKMVKVVDFSNLNERLREYEEQYNDAMAAYNAAVAHRDNIIKTRDRDEKALHVKIRRMWNSTLKGIIQRCQNQARMSFTGWDLAYVDTLLNLGPNYCRRKNHLKIHINEDACKKLEIDQILQFMKDAKELVDQDYKDEFNMWLSHSDEGALRHAAWMTTDREEQTRIQDEIEHLTRLKRKTSRYSTFDGYDSYEIPTDWDEYR